MLANKIRWYKTVVKNVVVLFGGQSSEHEISRMSARNVMNQIDSTKYSIIPVGITKEGEWFLYRGQIDKVTEETWQSNAAKVLISPDASDRCLWVLDHGRAEKINVDVVFPVLHGLYGEDGTIQGLLELAQIPYVGCGVLASAVSMDKVFTKIIAERLNIPQAKYLYLLKHQLVNMKEVISTIEKEIPYPVFVKPSNAGSSKGITKAHNRYELEDGLEEAAKHDIKIIIEETIKGREIECAVLGNLQPQASDLGEIVAAAEFYDYEAKYYNNDSKTIIGPDLKPETTQKIKDLAIEIFKGVDGRGLARVDFFVEPETERVIFNEINTLPGFTSISMYPMLFEAAGISKKELVSRLIELAFDRNSH